MVVGNRSDEVGGILPDALRPHCELRGYVSEAELHRAYAESRGLFLLSDFEAFGIPILESLASATPVFLSEQEATRSLFGSFRGAYFCPGDDTERTLEIVDRVLDQGRASVAEIQAENRRLKATFGWEDLAERKWRALSAAWFRRSCWTASA